MESTPTDGNWVRASTLSCSVKSGEELGVVLRFLTVIKAHGPSLGAFLISLGILLLEMRGVLKLTGSKYLQS